MSDAAIITALVVLAEIALCVVVVGVLAIVRGKQQEQSMRYCDNPNCECHKDEPVNDGPQVLEAKPPKAGISIGRMRNKPCPCGSGRKFKACCIRKAAGGRVVIPGWNAKDYSALNDRVA
jgi:hypothetical protein